MPFTSKVTSWYDNAFALFQPFTKIEKAILAVPMIGARFDSPRQGVKVALIEIKEDEPAVKEVKATKELSETTASANQSKSATEGKSKATGGVTNKPVQKPNPTQPIIQKPAANPKPEEKVEVNHIGPAIPPVEEDPPIDTSIEELEDELPPVEY